MAVGVLIYFAYGRRHSVLASREADVYKSRLCV
jgi:hypothetical protein